MGDGEAVQSCWDALYANLGSARSSAACPITHIPHHPTQPAPQAGVEKCPKLRVLYASNNRLKDWAEVERLGALPELEDLLLMGNPLYNEWRDNNALPQYRIEVCAAGRGGCKLGGGGDGARTPVHVCTTAAAATKAIFPLHLTAIGAQAGAHTEEAGWAAGGCGGARGGGKEVARLACTSLLCCSEQTRLMSLRPCCSPVLQCFPALSAAAIYTFLWLPTVRPFVLQGHGSGGSRVQQGVALRHWR